MAEIAHDGQPAGVERAPTGEAAPGESVHPAEVPAKEHPEALPVSVFADRRLLALVVAVPILTTGVLVATRFFPADPMLASGLVAVVVGFLAFLLMTSYVPGAFSLVRLRGLVPDSHLGAYAAFEREVGSALNSRWAVLLGAAGGIIGFARFPVAAGGIGELLGDGPSALSDWGLIAVGDIAGETLIGAAAGLAIWRMIVIGVKVHQLGRFPLRVQLGHPDRCGGFQPLGNLCLWNALVLSVPGVFLGWWIIAGPASQYGSRYVALHSLLASLVVVLATIAFLLPLWSIHRSMVRDATHLRDDIERHGQRIDRLTRDLVAARDDIPSETWEAMARDLERRQELYKANEKVPTWPIDARLATKFGTSQLVPLLGVTGMSKPIVDAVKAVSSFVEGPG